MLMHSNRNHQQNERQPKQVEKIIPNHIVHKGLNIQNIWRTYIQVNNKKQIALQNGQRIWVHIFSEDIQMDNRYMKKCSISLIIKEMQIKPQWGITSHLSEWLSSKRDDKCRWRCGEKKCLYTNGRNANWHNHHGKQYGDSSKN